MYLGMRQANISKRCRFLVVRIIAELMNLRSLRFECAYVPATSSRLGNNTDIKGSLARHLTSLYLEAQPSKSPQALNPELVAALLRQTRKLRSLKLRKVGF